MSQKITGLASMLKAIGINGAEAKEAAGVLEDLDIGEVGKATTSQSLKPGEEVKDRWDSGEMHRAPTREEIKVGPTQRSSGGGAEKMISEYSNPAPQDGTVTVPERLERELGSLQGYMRSHIEKTDRAVGALTQVLTAVLASKAAEGESGFEPDVFTARFAEQAKGRLSAGRKFLSKARRLHDDLDDLEGEARKTCKAQIKDLRKSAAKMLCSALEASFAAKSEVADPAAEVRKAVAGLLEDDTALKADMNTFHEKDKEKDEEDRAEKSMKKLARKAAKQLAAKAEKKAAKKAAKAAKAEKEKEEEKPAEKSDAKGNQNDKQDTRNSKNQDDSAAKAAELAAAVDQVQKAAEGLGVLSMNVNQMFNVIRGKPVTTLVSNPLEILKSRGDDKPSIFQLIEAAADNDELDQAGVMKASDLASKLENVANGALSKERWSAALQASPTAVQNIFARAA